MVDQVEIRLGLGIGLFIGVLGLVGLADLEEGYRFGIALCLVAALGATLTPRYAALLAISAWAILTGFVINAYGVLTFGHLELALLAELFALTVGASLLSRRVRRSNAQDVL
jgi:hypothetical protein